MYHTRFLIRTARKVHGVDFQATLGQIRKELLSKKSSLDQIVSNQNNDSNIQVYIRKRPMLSHEPKKKEYDIITCVDQQTIGVHDCQMYAGTVQ